MQASNAISYDHLLLALLDANPYLSAGSKQALATTAGLAVQNKSRITVLMVDAQEPSGDPAVRLENIQWCVYLLQEPWRMPHMCATRVHFSASFAQFLYCLVCWCTLQTQKAC